MTTDNYPHVSSRSCASGASPMVPTTQRSLSIFSTSRAAIIQIEEIRNLIFRRTLLHPTRSIISHGISILTYEFGARKDCKNQLQHSLFRDSQNIVNQPLHPVRRRCARNSQISLLMLERQNLCLALPDPTARP